MVQHIKKKKKRRIVMILVNALLEWILISLLLLNSLFTYLITKYTHFFGLNNSSSDNHAATHCLATPNLSQHMCQYYYCTIEDEDEKDTIEDELENDRELEQAHNDDEEEHKIVSDVEEEDSHNHNILLLLQSNEDDSLQLQTTHCCLRPIPLDLIDSLMLRGPLTMDLFEQDSYRPHHNITTKEDQLHTPLLEAYEESRQVKPLSYIHNNHDSANGEIEPETPTSLDNLHNDKLLLLSEKRDFSSYSSTSVEECLDESIHRAVTVEGLKSALTSERKTLRAVYAELEEERSASAIAANHTMAMITRLQEEKAAMQMEALQYQRMMEEQAEYDHEALQLLNHLILNKEKEKDELAKELDMYRENHNIIKEGDYTDDDNDTWLSIDLNRPMIKKHTSDYNSDDDDDFEVIALDCMKHMSQLNESVAQFEEEKLSILDQLKLLEEKLLMMSVEDNNIEDVQNETMQSMAKQLLPLLDEAEDNQSTEMEKNLVQEFPDDENEPNKVDGVAEVDRVYTRLKALEEETVKEDKQGTSHLVKEILQNLRDLKTVEFTVQTSVIA